MKWVVIFLFISLVISTCPPNDCPKSPNYNKVYICYKHEKKEVHKTNILYYLQHDAFYPGKNNTDCGCKPCHVDNQCNICENGNCTSGIFAKALLTRP